jgi:hypothetical protein
VATNVAPPGDGATELIAQICRVDLLQSSGRCLAFCGGVDLLGHRPHELTPAPVEGHVGGDQMPLGLGRDVRELAALNLNDGQRLLPRLVSGIKRLGVFVEVREQVGEGLPLIEPIADITAHFVIRVMHDGDLGPNLR